MTLFFEKIITQNNYKEILTEIKILKEEKQSFDKTYLMCEILF